MLTVLFCYIFKLFYLTTSMIYRELFRVVVTVGNWYRHVLVRVMFKFSRCGWCVTVLLLPLPRGSSLIPLDGQLQRWVLTAVE